MSVPLVVLGTACVSILMTSHAWAQAYKCKDEQGRTTYSDSPCEGKSRTVINTQPNSGGGITAEDARRQLRYLQSIRGGGYSDAPQDRASESSAPEGRGGSQKYRALSNEESQNRIRELEIETKRMGATKEQKAAARAELQALSRGSAQALDQNEIRQREDLYKDAGSLDKAKRKNAESSLERQTDKYENPGFLKQRTDARAELKRQEEERQKQVAASAVANAQAAADEMNRQSNNQSATSGRGRQAKIVGCDAVVCRDSAGTQYRPSGVPGMYYGPGNKKCRTDATGVLSCS